jgi:FkbM family methyltransferase
MTSPACRARQALATGVVLQLARRTRFAEPEMLGLRDLVKPGSICFDIGAAAGLYTLELSRLAGPKGQVHSFEPVPFAHPVLTRMLGTRTTANVCHHPIALGVEPGHGVMSVPVGRLGPVTGRSFLDADCAGQGSNAEFRGQIGVDVEVQTLDGVCAAAKITRLDFVKIDVEGAELLVLQGGRASIERFRPMLLVEIEDRHTARYRHAATDVATWLEQRDYEMRTWQDGWQKTDTVCAHARNYLFLPRQSDQHTIPPALTRPASAVPDADELAPTS